MRKEGINKDDNEKINICGGVNNIQCPKGYYCQKKDKSPDNTGVCIKVKEKIDFVCPKSAYIDCMPGIYQRKSECNPLYLQWVEKNCPNFKGVVY